MKNKRKKTYWHFVSQAGMIISTSAFIQHAMKGNWPMSCMYALAGAVYLYMYISETQKFSKEK